MRAARHIVLSLGLLSCVWACNAQPQAQDVYTLRYATPYPPHHPFSRADQRWIDHVHAATSGKLRIDAFWAGRLTSSDQSSLELRHGVADVAAIQPIYQRGGARLLRAQTGFYAGARNFVEQVSVYKCLADQYPAFAAELTELHVLAVQGGNLPGIATRETKVRSLRDLAGLRLRAPTELMDVLERLGADPVSMPMGDVYASLARGVIDGVVAPLDALRSLHLAEVARHFTSMAIPRGAYPARAIRDQALVALPAALQAIVRDSGTVWEAALADELNEAEQAGRAYAATHHITMHELPDADQAAFLDAYNRAARTRARALPHGEAIFDAAQHWVAALHSSSAPWRCD